MSAEAAATQGTDASHKTLSEKGLKAGSVGLLGAVVIGVSCIAPAYTLTAALGPTVSEVGVHLPAIFLVGFIPMLLVALGYRELNKAMPDAGTSFTWATRAFGPWIGWLGGWGLIAATIIVLSGPVMGPFAILMSLAILSSSAASLQSTFVSPARTLLSMGHYRALPRTFGKVSPAFKSPSYATIAAAVAAAAFYVITRTTSENALWDTITALGMMICFYYGITALACVWFFRAVAFSGARAFFFKFLAPLLGCVILLVMFFKTAYDSMDPEYGSGSSVGGVGMVFILGMGVILLGVVIMLVMARVRPEFFKGQVLARGR